MTFTILKYGILERFIFFEIISECSEIINYPSVMSEEPYGIVFGYYPFHNIELQRIKKLKNLR